HGSDELEGTASLKLWRCVQAVGCTIFVCYSLPLFLVAPIGVLVRAGHCLAPVAPGLEAKDDPRCRYMGGLLASFASVTAVMLAGLLVAWCRAKARGRDLTDCDEENIVLEADAGYVAP
ncbi:unnamed protein product, partial [Polarella glacialis]